MIKYDKLVRDRIPEIIIKSGKDCDTVLVEGKEKYKFLEAKLKEEVNEFFKDKNIEELADVMEVLYGLADSLGYSEEELNNVRLKKLEQVGGFKSGIVLKLVTKKEE